MTEIASEPWLRKLKSPAKLKHHSVGLPLEMVFVIVRNGRRSIRTHRRFQFVSSFQENSGRPKEVLVMDEHIQIAGGTCRKVVVDGCSQHNALKRHGRNLLVIEGFEHGNQFRRVRQTVEHVAIVFGSQAFLRDWRNWRLQCPRVARNSIGNTRCSSASLKRESQSPNLPRELIDPLSGGTDRPSGDSAQQFAAISIRSHQSRRSAEMYSSSLPASMDTSDFIESSRRRLAPSSRANTA